MTSIVIGLIWTTDKKIFTLRKKLVQAFRPLIPTYNNFKRGTDLMNENINRYRITIEEKIDGGVFIPRWLTFSYKMFEYCPNNHKIMIICYDWNLEET